MHSASMRMLRAVAPIFSLSLLACGTAAPSDIEAGIDATADASDASDVLVPPCHSADAAAPPDASDSWTAGVGVCCASASECTLSTAICVGGRCCIPVHDSGRRCHANSDCCSLQCSCGDACDPSSSGGGECAPYP